MRAFDYSQPFASRRSPVMGRRGAVATSHPLAAQVGLDILREGGNAADAAVATAAALTVLEPTSNGIGGDAFAIVWDGKRLHGLNASGRCPKALDVRVFESLGLHRVPTTGWLPVTTPGAVSAWVELAKSFGTMPLSRLVAPAARYAEEGHPIPPIIAGYWKAAERRLGEFEEFRRAFLPGGRAPLPGEVFRLPDQAATLRLIGDSNGEAFYRGEIAERIARHAEATGGYLSREDLASHEPRWVDPIHVTYRGYDIWEIPPNGQGIVALITLGILEGFDMPSRGRASADELHLAIEGLKLAFADAYSFVADPISMRITPEMMLDPAYLARRRELIQMDKAVAEPAPGHPNEGASREGRASSHEASSREDVSCCAHVSPVHASSTATAPGGRATCDSRISERPQLRGHRPFDGDTVYLCTADASGMMVSYIQSNYMGFGSGIVIPGTGISMQNRGCGFTLEEGHPNRLAPGKRPYHTIIPAFITRDGVPLAAFGVMGGDMQPQGHVQVILGLIDHAMNPQAALDAPRVRVLKGSEVAVEPAIGREVAEDLARRGHQVRVDEEPAGFGGGQIIWRDPDSGVFICGSEPRKDGAAVAW
ncbi:MAG: gamma-glutamyltransferase family protein [Firmicutes bacterium]|jgi:gamma-glutamyltranspeptidase/glutathione hydrolase|nr:gamma-glutamyltransferase family protein [Bacillota bacterium]MDH7496402.1 gamma-glutamyltransferase family protein [Bacillota bacterium]